MDHAHGGSEGDLVVGLVPERLRVRLRYSGGGRLHEHLVEVRSLHPPWGKAESFTETSAYQAVTARTLAIYLANGSTWKLLMERRAVGRPAPRVACELCTLGLHRAAARN
jgi:hypothetical protein